MAALKYREEHNKVGYLEKPKGSDDYHQVLDFLRGSHFRYALTHDPIIFDSLVKQLWLMASLRAPELGSPTILAMIDRTPYTITEDTIRRQLQLGDDGGIEDLPIADIYLGMDDLGYPTEGKLTFYKNMFSPQWRDHMPLLAAMLPPDQATIADEGAHESESCPISLLQIVENETLGGSFNTTPPRSTQVPHMGPTSGVLRSSHTTALASLVSKIVQGKKGKRRAGCGSLLIKLAKAAAASDAHVDVSPGADVPPSPPHPTSDVPTTEVPTDVPSVGAPTGPSTVSPGSTTVPTSSSVPAAETIPASSGTTPETPSSPVRDARKGKGVAVEEPTPTHDKSFKQLEEERLGWEAAQRLQAQELADFEKQRAESLMKDANLARQMSQDFEMTEDQRKRQQEVLASAANYSDAAWDIILARLQANPDLSSTIFRVEFTDDDFAARMVALVNTRQKELAAQRAQERMERPITPSQLRQYMRTYVKNQGPTVYSTS
ncbi:hypothetical protein Tco_0983489 [Tanacetum coccineum]